MIDPNLYYQVWKVESAERIRQAGLRQLAAEARSARRAERASESVAAAGQRGWLSPFREGALRLRRLSPSWLPVRNQ